MQSWIAAALIGGGIGLLLICAWLVVTRLFAQLSAIYEEIMELRHDMIRQIIIYAERDEPIED